MCHIFSIIEVAEYIDMTIHITNSLHRLHTQMADWYPDREKQILQEFRGNVVEGAVSSFWNTQHLVGFTCILYITIRLTLNYASPSPNKLLKIDGIGEKLGSRVTEFLTPNDVGFKSRIYYSVAGVFSLAILFF